MPPMDALTDLILDRLDASTLSPDAQLFCYAAVEGETAFDDALGGRSALPAPTASTNDPDAPQPLGAYLTHITAEGFRGIGPSVRLQLAPGPGLTVVCGRNGSGKSSLAEALEIVLTGTSARWDGRTAEWQTGWRNLHHHTCKVAVGLLIEGDAQPEAELRRTWPNTATTYHDSVGVLQRKGDKAAPFSDLGWQLALVNYQPYLSHDELGAVLTAEPKQLFDTLSGILGLEALTAADTRLRRAHAELDRQAKESRAAGKALGERLGDSDDPRAAEARRLLAARTPDLDRVAVLCGAGGDDAIDPELDRLRAIARLAPFDLDAVLTAADALAAASKTLAQLPPDPDADAAQLLSQALAWRHRHGGGACPVCGVGRLDDAWASTATATVARIEAASGDRTNAIRARDDAERQLRRTLPPPPPALDCEPWRALAALPDDPQLLVDHVRAQASTAHQAASELIENAATEVAARDDRWRPLALDLAVWLANARTVADAAPRARDLKAAFDWLRATEHELRNARLAPLASESKRLWGELRQDSNVELLEMTLEGANTRRKVNLDVRVDGTPSSALAVMSQGELNALALSVFLPRATLPESPFRFLVIDDPVQAMDPSKVDGLARVLHEVARVRQVVVFTHDDRLPQSLRRLRLDAHILEVVRGEESEVSVRPVCSPPVRHWQDAEAILLDAHVSDDVVKRVVPGMLRVALEAACQARIRRTRLATPGVSHADVETLLESHTKLYPLLALALFDDESRTGDVLARLNSAHGRWAADLAAALNKGAHGAADLTRPEVRDKAHATKRLIEALGEWDA